MYRIVQCDCGEYIIVKSYQRYARCPRCGMKLPLQKFVTYEKSNDIEYLRRVVYYLRKRRL